jgi:hypothetical protein
MKYKNKNIYLFVVVLLSTVFVCSSGDAKITGNCANCHTMHASQNGTSGGIAFGGSSLPQPVLLRGDCLGCHGQNTSSKIVTIGGSQIPQVLHRDGSGDLAGGNFAYILGSKGSGASDAKGHNVIEINNQDNVLNNPPGPVNQFDHEIFITKSTFTCAGYHGCHGKRDYAIPPSPPLRGIASLKGAHHSIVDGKCDNPTDVFNSYRFLMGVKGLENTVSKWQNAGPADHNEYYGVPPPPSYNCNADGCHIDIGPGRSVVSINRTISGFCGTCHGNFHGAVGGTGSGTSDGIGIGGTSSPFRRHPTDITLPNSGEYSAYTTYSVEAPIARQTVPDNASSVVQPGTDVVMCLSCHAAHGTNYPDILKWDYSTMIAGGGRSGGCFTCHTQK